MISAGEFRNGVTIEVDNDIFTIIEFQHVKPGKGAAFVRTRLKNIMTGNVLERTFRPTERMARAHIERKDMQYSYNDGDLYHFMDLETYEQVSLNSSDVGDALKFVRENDMVKTTAHNGKIFGIEPMQFVELKVIETEPGFKGDTSGGNVTKPAIVETGVQVHVPLFVERDDVIQIDTRTSEYLKRV